MGPEIPNSGSGTDAFAEMAASMPSYGDHLANQTGLPPESPPIPAGESNLANEPPNNEQKQTTETIPATESSPKPATVKTSEAVKDTTESAADFSPEELAGIQKYADELETGAKKDQKMADLLHQFVDIASYQHSNSQKPAATIASVESTPSSAAPQNTSEQPSPIPKPAIPDATAAIAEALAETAGTPIPGQTPISTPPESPAGSFSGNSPGENPAAA